MACSCAEGWSTTILAAKKGLFWRNASPQHCDCISAFCESGGCGSHSLNRFAKESLLDYANLRYANSVLLVDGSGALVGFVANAMGSINMTEGDMTDLNIGHHIESVPVLFLHRLGVHTSYQNKGIGKLLGWRVFEALAHSCIHTAAAGVALQVDSDNTNAKKLYASLGFAKIEFSNQRGQEMHVIPYSDAISRIPRVG